MMNLELNMMSIIGVGGLTEDQAMIIEAILKWDENRPDFLRGMGIPNRKQVGDFSLIWSGSR